MQSKSCIHVTLAALPTGHRAGTAKSENRLAAAISSQNAVANCGGTRLTEHWRREIHIFVDNIVRRTRLFRPQGASTSPERSTCLRLDQAAFANQEGSNQEGSTIHDTGAVTCPAERLGTRCMARKLFVTIAALPDGRGGRTVSGNSPHSDSSCSVMAAKKGGPVFLVGRSAMAAAIEGAGPAGYAFPAISR